MNMAIFFIAAILSGRKGLAAGPEAAQFSRGICEEEKIDKYINKTFHGCLCE